MSNRRRLRPAGPRIVAAEFEGMSFLGDLDDLAAAPVDLLPEEMPANVRAFIDQLEAGQASGELSADQRWHLDVGWHDGAEVGDLFLPRLCSAPDRFPCFGGCE